MLAYIDAGSESYVLQIVFGVVVFVAIVALVFKLGMSRRNRRQPPAE